VILSFTGTRDGMTKAQSDTVIRFFQEHLEEIELAVHGDCVGADVDFHVIAQGFGIPIRIRPSDHPTRAFCEGAAEVFPPKNPLVRNVEIVADGTQLIGCSKTFEEARRSGTWHAIRQGRKFGKPITVVWPDGTTTEEG